MPTDEQVKDAEQMSQSEMARNNAKSTRERNFPTWIILIVAGVVLLAVWIGALIFEDGVDTGRKCCGGDQEQVAEPNKTDEVVLNNSVPLDKPPCVGCPPQRKKADTTATRATGIYTELDVVPPLPLGVLRASYKRVRSYDKDQYNYDNFTVPAGLTHEMILAALIAQESRNDPDIKGDSGKANGILQVHEPRAKDLQTRYGVGYQHQDYLGEKGVGISLWQFGAVGQYIVPKGLRGNIHAWIKSMKGKPTDGSPTEYSTRVLEGAKLLKRDIEEHGEDWVLAQAN